MQKPKLWLALWNDARNAVSVYLTGTIFAYIWKKDKVNRSRSDGVPCKLKWKWAIGNTMSACLYSNSNRWSNSFSCCRSRTGDTFTQTIVTTKESVSLRYCCCLHCLMLDRDRVHTLQRRDEKKNNNNNETIVTNGEDVQLLQAMCHTVSAMNAEIQK